MRKRLKGLLARGGDAALAVALVVVFFLIFMVILMLSFPKGVGLQNEFRPAPPAARSAPRIATGSTDASWEPSVARLASVTRTVKAKQAASIVWSAADAGMDLGEQDAIQTFSRSGARLVFARDQEVSLGEDSLIVIRRSEKDKASGTRRASVVLLLGVLEGSIASAPGVPSSVTIVAGNASATIESPKSGKAQFRVAAATDDASALSVTSGQAELRVGDRTVTVRAGQTVTVTPQGSIQGPRSIVKAPVLVAPANGAVLRSRVLPAEVAFAWEDDTKGRTYRLEIARDASLRDPFVDTRVAATAWSCPELPAGRYYWRVRSTQGVSEGRVAAVRGFEVGSDLEPPSLGIDFPEGPLAHGPITLRGQTEPSAKVYIGKVPVLVGPDGAFEVSVVLRRGAQIVVIEAVDIAGNVAYVSRTLAAR